MVRRDDAVGKDDVAAAAVVLRHEFVASRAARVDEQPAFARPCAKRCMTRHEETSEF
jgi:hypothetical protein